MIEELENLQQLHRDEISPKELADLPRDGRRYEIVDGELLVTGAQPPAHRAAVIALMIKLKHSCPPDLLVAVGSLDYRPTWKLSLRPDLLVCNRSDAGPRFTTAPLLLAVEVLSPSTRVTDVVLKRGLYEQSGVQSYWLLDPTNQELTILDLTTTHYTCQAVIQGEESFSTTLPFPVHLSPAELTP
ncbi:Uma2 family endonuclease [Kribbella sancticallisti]|uniref:Uma2 family endonuclease n=1 Tax=Kribbella sancticallisti TaxID=460087 RepID=A0ABN2EC44_9ACTN